MSCSEWKTYILRDVANYSTEKISIDEINTMNYISTENMLPNKSGRAEASSIPNSKSVPLYKKGDILISNIRPYFKKIWFADINGGSSTDVLIIQNKNKDIIIDKFLYYSLFQDKFFDYVMSGAKGTKMPRGDKNAIMKYQLNIPSIEEQKKIVNIFNNIDKKIELNNKMNKTLEEMAQALFKRWFIDFEFPNEEEGKPYKSSGGEMIESEMGMIPKGWHVGCLADLVNIKYGKDHKKLEDGDIPVYGSGGIMRYVNKSLYEKESVLIPRKGTLNNVMYVNQPFWSVDTMFFTEMKLPNIAKFVYQFVKSKDLAKMNMGSAVPSMTTSILNSMKIVIPDKMNLQKFNEIVSTFYDKIEFNDNNTKNLIKVRDSLLPKLMNGEININNIAAIL